MKVPTHDKRIVKLLHLQFSYDDYNLLLVIQSKHPNMLLEVESSDTSRRSFVPAHLLDLENFQSLTLYNLPNN